jgi:hypothetical protein
VQVEVVLTVSSIILEASLGEELASVEIMFLQLGSQCVGTTLRVHSTV